MLNRGMGDTGEATKDIAEQSVQDAILGLLGDDSSVDAAVKDVVLEALAEVTGQSSGSDDGDLAGANLRKAVAESADARGAAALAQRMMVSALMKEFLDVYKAGTPGYGYVSIQGDPYAEDPLCGYRPGSFPFADDVTALLAS